MDIRQVKLECNGKGVELNEFASKFLASVVLALVSPLRDVPDAPGHVVAVRSQGALSIEVDGKEVEWFMEFPKVASMNVLDAAIKSLKGCETFGSYTLEVTA